MLPGKTFKVGYISNSLIHLIRSIWIIYFSFRCSARIRTKHIPGQKEQLQIIDLNHTHKIITSRREYGSLKKMRELEEQSK